LYGIRSERRLESAGQRGIPLVRGHSLTDKVLNATTFTQNRRRNGTTIFQEIFDEIVLQAMKHGFDRGERTVYGLDVLKANANKNRFTRQMVRQSTEKYVEELDRAINEDRETHGKRPLKKKYTPEVEKKSASAH
jgi:hypothetical protein